MRFTPNLSRSEQKYGFITMAICLLLLPGALTLCIPGISDARLNFTVYFITAAAIVYVLRRFLLRNAAVALVHPVWCIYYACLGYLAQLAFREILGLLVWAMDPGFVNLNDQAILSQLDSEFGLVVITTVVLAPIAEECFFRGVLLRGLFDRSPVLAWVLSVGLFAAVHVMGFIGVYSPLELLLAAIQYVPAGIGLAIAYQRGGNIFSPILAHAIINGMAVLSVTR